MSNIAAQAAWREFLEALKGADGITEQLSDPGDDRLGLEACGYLLMSLAQGYAFNFASDPDFPHFTPNVHWPNASMGNSPDFTYYFTPVRPQGVYRIWGTRNNIHVVDFQIGEAFYGKGNNQGLASYDLDDLTIAADGGFEFILSAQRPEGWTGDWRELLPTAEMITVRQVAYDWFAERDAVLNIARLDAPTAVPPRPSAQNYREALLTAARYTQQVSKQFVQYPKMLREKGFINGPVFSTDFSDFGGFSDQLYYMGIFDLADDEALLLEMPVPQVCRYWNLQLCNEFFAGTDYIFRHGSLNGRQAHVDADGRCRIVISRFDPGIANWLDTNDLKVGMFLGRWKQSDAKPLPTVQKVALAEIGRHVPADTRRVTPVERAAIVMARRTAVLDRIGH